MELFPELSCDLPPPNLPLLQPLCPCPHSLTFNLCLALTDFESCCPCRTGFLLLKNDKDALTLRVVGVRVKYCYFISLLCESEKTHNLFVSFGISRKGCLCAKNDVVFGVFFFKCLPFKQSTRLSAKYRGWVQKGKNWLHNCFVEKSSKMQGRKAGSKQASKQSLIMSPPGVENHKNIFFSHVRTK